MSEQDNSSGIGEASEQTGLPESTIRFYDREFSDYLDIERGDNNQRLFSSENLKDLEYIRYLIKREDMSVEEVSQRLEREGDFKQRQQDAGDSSGKNATASSDQINQLRDSLNQLKSDIRELQSTVNAQDETIEAMKNDQENMLQLLDMNLERYNQLVDDITN